RVRKASRSSRHIARDMASSLPGCESVTRASGPSNASRTCPGISVGLDVGGLHDDRPALDLAVDEAGELLLRQVGELRTLLRPDRLQLRGLDGLAHFVGHVL